MFGKADCLDKRLAVCGRFISVKHHHRHYDYDDEDDDDDENTNVQDQSCEMSNFLHRQKFEFKILPQKRVIRN